MFEKEEKYVDNSGRILTVLSVDSGVQASLEGEIKMFISPDSFNNYLKNNNFDKINLTPEDNIEEFEQEVQHLINTDSTTMKNEAILKRLDKILENKSDFSRLTKSFKMKEGISTSTLQFNYYGAISGVDAFEGTFSLRGLRKVARFIPNKPFLFSFIDTERNLVRFFVISDGEYPQFATIDIRC